MYARSMHVASALAMVSEYLDDAAFADFTMAALVHHALKLLAQSLEPRDPFLDLGHMSLRDAVGFMAGALWFFAQLQKLAYIPDLKAQFAGMPDEGETAQILLIELAAIPLAARRRWQQANLLVKADGRHFHACLPGGFADGYAAVRHFRACSSSR